MKPGKRRFLTVISIATGVAVVVVAVFIMAKGLGLVDGLDFGAGAYYYADIPDFEKYLHTGAFSARLPLWVYIMLFLLWGALMYGIWIWMERRKH